jgi:death-associated protein kinase
MFLARSLHNLQVLRKTNSQYPVIAWRQFVDLIREKVNPLASNEHFREVIQQLQLMGEVVYLEGNLDEHLICINPSWLCHNILGNLFCHEHFNRKQLSGLFTNDDLESILGDSMSCANMSQLKKILNALDICCAVTMTTGDDHESIDDSDRTTTSSKAVFEFPALNLIDVPTSSEIWEDNNDQPMVYNGIRIRCTSTVKTLMACMFPRLQVRLRSLVNLVNSTNRNVVNEVEEEQDRQEQQEQEQPIKEQAQRPMLKKLVNQYKFGLTLYDIDLYQWRYGSKIQRLSPSGLECLITLDIDGHYIEIKARGPLTKREELFYFIQDVHSFTEQTIMQSLPGLNLEMHYLSPTTLAKQLTTTRKQPVYAYTPKQICQMHLDKTKHLMNPMTNEKEAYLDIVCCGSEHVNRNLVYGMHHVGQPLMRLIIIKKSFNVLLGIDLSMQKGLTLYTRRMLCRLLDDVDPMGRDWCLLAILLNLQDTIPKLDTQNINLSKFNYLVDEWSSKHQLVTNKQPTVRLFFDKLSELGRKDVCELIMSTGFLFKINLPDDSGIRNSSQTLDV